MPSASKLFCAAKVWAEGVATVTAPGLPEGQPARPQAGVEGRAWPDVWVPSPPPTQSHQPLAALACGLDPLGQELLS